jgi:hypothetical protein
VQQCAGLSLWNGALLVARLSPVDLDELYNCGTLISYDRDGFADPLFPDAELFSQVPNFIRLFSRDLVAIRLAALCLVVWHF